ncbi:hypothetical protein B0H16DRAFT_1775019 [Mycena metata]|uniref:Uncharacterized protein n=1 Tax=Mycena metata TaxID=1033252 RepID=A0AAD7JS16_9AGAR|nr:hypothetical protein B0H16DRAFT_1775019 [Mycena metata]
MFLGGQSLFSRYTNVISNVYNALSGYHAVNRKHIDIYSAVPDDDMPLMAAYSGPKVLIAHFKHETVPQTEVIKTMLAGQHMFTCTETSGSTPSTCPKRRHASLYPLIYMLTQTTSVGIRNYTLASYAVSTCTDPAFAERYSRGGARKLWFEIHGLVQEGDQQSQALSNGTLQEHIKDAVWTINTKYYDHETDPIVTVYMKPITDNPANHEHITRIFHTHSFNMGPLSFTPKAYRDEAPECVICTSGDHFVYLCPFSRLTAFWGPKKQLSKYTEGILARGRSFARGAFARGGPRGRGAHAYGRGQPTHGARGRGNNCNKHN